MNSPHFPSSTQPPVAMPFRVCRTLGKGGYGVVYQVQDPLSKRTVALKILRRDKGVSFLRQRRFLREISITSQLEHPNIVPLYQSGRLADGSMYYSMRELRGRTLRDYISEEKVKAVEEQRRGLGVRLEVFSRMAQAVAYAHSQGVIHRDLKPANVALDNFGQVLVLDWGLARKVDGEEEKKADPYSTGKGSLLGTPGYMSPEQADGQSVDERSDVFALGVILFEVLAFKIPFHGPVAQRLSQTLTMDYPTPREFAPELEIPREVSAIAAKAMAYDLEERYPSVEALLDDLQAFREGRGVSALPDSVWRDGVRWMKFYRWPLVGVAVVLTAMLVAAIAMEWSLEARRIQKVKEIEERGMGWWKKARSLAAPLKKPVTSLSVWQVEESSDRGLLRRRALQAYFKAREAVERFLAHGGDLEKGRRKLAEIEREMGLLALGGRNYLLSQICFDRHKNLGGEEGDQLLAMVERVRGKEVKEGLENLEKLVEEIKGRSDVSSEMLDEYVTRLVAEPRPYMIKALLPHIYSSHPSVRLVAIEALGKLGDNWTKVEGKTAGEWLLKKLKQVLLPRDEHEAIELVWALGRLRQVGALEVTFKLRRQVGDETEFWRSTITPAKWMPLKKVGKGDSSYLSQWYKKAIFYREKREYVQSIAAFTRVLERAPHHFPSLLQRSSCYIETKQYHRAQRDLENVLRRRPHSVNALYYLALVSYEQENFPRALRAINRALKRKPTGRYYDVRASIYRGLGQEEQAMADLNRAVEVSPKVGYLYNNRGLMWMSKGEYDKAERDFTRSIDLNDDQKLAYLNRARIFLQKEQFVRALEDANQALRIDPRLSKAYALRAAVRWKQRDLDRARKDLAQAKKLDPNDPMIYRYMGEVKVTEKQWRQAAKDFARCLQLEPDNYRSLYMMGACQQKLGNYEASIRYMAKALAHYRRVKPIPGRTDIIGDILCYMGVSNLKLGRVGRTESLITQALERQKLPTYYYYRARARKALGKKKECLRDYDRALELDQSNHIYYNDRGYLRAMWFSGDKKALKQALADCNRAVRSRSNQAHYYDSRGFVLYQMGREDEALRDFNRALTLRPPAVDALYHRGVIWKKRGLHGRAVRDFRTYLQYRPQAAERREIEAYLKSRNH